MRNRMIRAAIGVTTATVLAAGLTACGDDGDSAPQSIKGIAAVGSDCKSGKITVKVYDADNGDVVATRYFSVGKSQRTLVCSSNALFGRSAFNTDYTQLGITQQVGSGWHAGTLSATDKPGQKSEFTDLSGDVNKASAPVSQTAGVFKDNKFYTVQVGGDIRVVDMETSKVTMQPQTITVADTDENEHPINRAVTVRDDVCFLPFGTKLETACRTKVLSPDGDWGFQTISSDNIVYGDLDQVADGDVSPWIGQPSSGEATGFTTFEAETYLNRKQFIARSSSEHFIVTMSRESATIKPFKLDVNNAFALTPDTDRRQLAFATGEDGSGELRIASINGGKSRRVADITSTPYILEWVQ